MPPGAVQIKCIEKINKKKKPANNNNNIVNFS